jgi:glucuronoarabinoxylan endo-1,4-beta-xylanase
MRLPLEVKSRQAQRSGVVGMGAVRVRIDYALILLSALAVAGCGGSGGSSNTTPVTKTTPTITWAAPAAITYGTALSATQLDATASVPGSFVYTPALGNVPTAGSQTLSVAFTPSDTTDYNSASGSVTLTVNKATPTITWSPANLAAGNALTSAQLDASSGGVPGTFTYNPALGTVITAVGSTTLNVTFTPTDTTNYNNATGTATLQVVDSTTTVDFGTTYQTIRGFGGSEAWSGQMPASQINSLYGMGTGDLGLTIMRLRIAPTTWTSATQTADTTQWTAELVNGKAAQQLGATVFATPWSPPANLKDDNSVNTGHLNTASYADYANYLEAYVKYAASQGVNLYAISMQNEPDWDPCGGAGPTASTCYESCLWTGAQMDTWVANNASVLTVPLIMPESYYFASSMSDATLNDANAVNKVSIVGGHIYGAAPYYYTLAKSLNKDVWMTEHTVNLVTGETTTQSITDAINAAEEIHNSLTVGQYNAYVYWWLVNSTSLSYYSGLLGTDGNPTFFGDAVAQYARFVRPGYVRASATANPLTGVFVSAYSGNGHQVIVAINSNTAAATIPFSIQNATVTTLTPYQTTATENLAEQSAIAVSNNAFTYALPAQSITTFVQ